MFTILAKIWEPTLKHIISLCDGLTTGIYVDEIWAMDFASYGDSALLNEKKLDDFCKSSFLSPSRFWVVDN
jgi:hypothetical protein